MDDRCELAHVREEIIRRMHRTNDSMEKSEAIRNSDSRQIRTYLNSIDFLVAMRLGETPVLIPNTMVKT